jgi:hypothetical protein
MPKIEVTDFENRGTAEHPFGFINFNDGLRIGYAPMAKGPNEDGLFEPDQPYSLRGVELSARHWLIATEWAREHLKKEGESCG